MLVPVTISFSIRYVVRTGLHQALRTFCDPVLGVTWDDPELMAGLRADGFDAVAVPAPAPSQEVRTAIRTAQDHLDRRLDGPSAAIERDRISIDRPLVQRTRGRLSWHRRQARAGGGDALERAIAELSRAVAEGSDHQTVTRFLRSVHIDGLLTLTPYTVQELPLLVAADRLCLPRCTSILSFDNLTTRPPLPITFDRYLVWNSFNADELRRSYPLATDGRVGITGPPQFDFYADDRWVEDETTWRDRLDIAAGAPTVLYGAGPPTIAPHEDQHVDDLLDAIDDGRLPSDLRIVLRRHPMDPPDRWQRFGHRRPIVFDDPGAIGRDSVRPGQVDLRDEQITRLCSSLAHTDVHLNVASTMTLDGAFFDKPQIGPAYDRWRGGRHDRLALALYRREHFAPIVASGGLELARSPEELIRLVSAALARPGRLSVPRCAMLAALCTFTDGRSTQRVADEVRSWADDVFPRNPSSG